MLHVLSDPIFWEVALIAKNAKISSSKFSSNFSYLLECPKWVESQPERGGQKDRF